MKIHELTETIPVDTYKLCANILIWRNGVYLMTLETVITNLENTIAGKRMLLDSLIDGSSSSTELTREYVRINISELSRILDDLKQINT